MVMPKKMDASERVFAAAKGVGGGAITAWSAFWHCAANSATFGLYGKTSGKGNKDLLRSMAKYSIGSLKEAVTGEVEEDKGDFI